MESTTIYRTRKLILFQFVHSICTFPREANYFGHIVGQANYNYVHTGSRVIREVDATDGMVISRNTIYQPQITVCSSQIFSGSDKDHRQSHLG